MSITVRCDCGSSLTVGDDFAGRGQYCPSCGRLVSIPNGSQPRTKAGSAAAEFVGTAPGAHCAAGQTPDRTRRPTMSAADSKRPDAADGVPVLTRMLEALLDPRAIQWMLMIGGGLTVIGLIIWLVSLGIFKDPRIMAAALGLGSLAVLGAGWWVTLKTRYVVAGQALTFLGCVVAPLNLWFYHVQGLITLDQHLWIGGFVCVLLYAGTVFVLRDPLFLYAVEAGITLTVLLLMADLGAVGDAANFSMWLVALGGISIHAERAFPPEGTFSRKRFGLTLFWSGHAQLAAALAVLLASQIVGWMAGPLHLGWGGNRLTHDDLLAGGLWIAAAYLYLYSDIVVRRIGVYTYLGAVCLLFAEVTLLLPHVNQEGLIAVLAVTSLAMLFLEQYLANRNEKLRPHLKMAGALMAQVPVLLGIELHLRATSVFAASAGFAYVSDWRFVAVMVLVVATNRLAAFMYRLTDSKLSSVYLFFSAAALLVAVAAVLRNLGGAAWYLQAPVLMLVPVAYVVAARLWRGRQPERPLVMVAQTATIVILAGTFVAALEQSSAGIFQPLSGRVENLYLGLTFAEAAVFYLLAGWLNRRSPNPAFATLAGCGALWQFLGYYGLPNSTYPLIYAGLGVATLAVSRVLGVELLKSRRMTDANNDTSTISGNGAMAFQCGNAVLTLALLAAFLQGLARLPQRAVTWTDLLMLVLTTLASAAAIVIVPAGGWRRLYATASIALSAVIFLTLNVLSHLNGWQKLEIFCVVAGIMLLAASYVGRFRETTQEAADAVSLGLWLGSLLAVTPLFVAMVYHRFAAGQPSLYDELGLLTVCILMLVSGLGWQIKATTLLGGFNLVSYLLILIIAIAYRPEVAVGIYLLIGGGLIFAGGVALSIYRDRLLALPESISRREGMFRIIDWR